MVRHQADAEDLTQQTFIEAYRALARYDPQRPFATWLMRIAANNCRDHLKSHKRKETSLSVAVSGEQAWQSGRVPSPEEQTISHRRAEQVAAALTCLNPKYRMPLILKDVEGLSYEEIREILDLPVSTLKIRVVRARAKLQELVQWTKEN